MNALGVGLTPWASIKWVKKPDITGNFFSQNLAKANSPTNSFAGIPEFRMINWQFSR